ncbi:hypothetical protein [Streptomyces virginiae]|uniref:hypothetical protein n=1 Tax=Streptomyces virginiae TaxID=1961 RepID=UPI0022554703|nr:hypothetical protein [Streptomyces virginiae]MCX4714904.1 hypothetical protein [Streptomyces virginiae]MCX5272622.1 hypothetical protein [Streptomyces virginiae]
MLLVALRALPGDRGLGLKAGADGLGALLVTSGLIHVLLLKGRWPSGQRPVKASAFSSAHCR